MFYMFFDVFDQPACMVYLSFYILHTSGKALEKVYHYIFKNFLFYIYIKTPNLVIFKFVKLFTNVKLKSQVLATNIFFVFDN